MPWPQPAPPPPNRLHPPESPFGDGSWPVLRGRSFRTGAVGDFGAGGGGRGACGLLFGPYRAGAVGRCVGPLAVGLVHGRRRTEGRGGRAPAGRQGGPGRSIVVRGRRMAGDGPFRLRSAASASGWSGPAAFPCGLRASGYDLRAGSWLRAGADRRSDGVADIGSGRAFFRRRPGRGCGARVSGLGGGWFGACAKDGG